MGVESESSIKCLSLSVWKQSVCVCLESLFVQILVVKEFACLDVTSCNKLNEINCLISFLPIVSPTVTVGIYQNQSMPPPYQYLEQKQVGNSIENVVHVTNG